MKVRATQDGTYGGYYRRGPTEDGQWAGEVFEIDEKPFEVRDPESGKAVLAVDEEGKNIPLLDEKGNPKKDSKGKIQYKIRMNTWFSDKWMEPVSEDTQISFDYPPFEIPVQYREKKKGFGGVGKGKPGMAVHSSMPVDSVI